MSKTLEYNGYSGSIEVSTEDNCIHGKILFINDLVTYEAETVPKLYAEFKESVDDYLQTCKEMGREAQKPFKGSFNIRISPDLHRKAALEATKEDTSLNELVAKAIECYVNKTSSINYEHHDHHHYHYEQHKNVISGSYEEAFTTPGEDQWKISPAIMSK